LEVFQSPEEANAYLDTLRARVSQANARGTAAEREAALVLLGQTAYEYASTDSVSDATRAALRRDGLNALLAAADLALADGRIRYTEKVATLAKELGDRATLDRAFAKYFGNYTDEKGRYLALNDYATALAGLQDPDAAERYLLDAIAMRPEPEYGIEARTRYVTHLVQTGRVQQALSVLDQFDPSMRANRPSMALYRQALMHSLGVDTTEVDKEVEGIRERLRHAVGVGPLPKLSAKVAPRPDNVLGIEEAYAFQHLAPQDDSRNFYAGWIPVQLYGGAAWEVTAVVINLAEVIWNEARGESFTAQKAVAWSVRNRATINMNGADFYPGAEGHGGTTECRIFSPPGPSDAEPYKRYSCALHGGTLSIGASHSQMNDAHVNVPTLQTIWAVDTALWVINGTYPDPTYNNFLPDIEWTFCYNPETNDGYPCPILNWWDGNPGGAQEWRSFNYCAANYTMKARRGNVGGNLTDPGSMCPNHDYATSGDNFFWGRMP
jgi:hypothetical protein